MGHWIWLFCWLLVWAMEANPASAQQASAPLPPQKPFLRIDPGMHTSSILNISVDGACKLLATASVDKSVRLWRLPTGELLRTLRLPIGDGNEGKIYAVAVSGDGTWLAAGGRDPARARLGGDFVYILDTATGAVHARLGPVEGSILKLAISPDGRHLAATLHRGQGLRVWKRPNVGVANWQLVAADKDYGGRASYGVAFDKAGVLYTTAHDGKLRRYLPGYAAKPIWISTRGKLPSAVAVHPSGDRVAVGFEDVRFVDVYSRALARRYSADTTKACLSV